MNKHHILPIHDGGPDLDWNLMLLNIDDHKLAHKLRYEVYQKDGDNWASRFLNKNTLFFQRNNAYRTHATCKQKKTGFYNPTLQAELGRKGGAVKSDAKDKSYEKLLSDKVSDIFENSTMVWEHKKFSLTITIKPGTIKIYKDLRQQLLNSYDNKSSDIALFQQQQEPKKDLAKISSPNFDSAFLKVLKRQRKSAYGWSVKIN